MANPADQYAKKTFGQVESQISRMYREAYKDVSKKMADFTRRHKAKDKQMQRDLKSGKITQAQYAQWMRGQVFIGQQWENAKASIDLTIKNVMNEAASLTHQKSVDVFVDNANYTAYQIEKDFDGGINFDLYDRKTVSRLILEDPELLPRKRDINGNKLEAWNTKTIANCVSQAIIQGESIDELSKRIARDTNIAAGRSSLLYARTAMTGAQNAGRVERMKEAEDMGIKVQKQWMATLDSRTRDSHAAMDGEIANTDGKFSNGLTYPGDPNGAPAEVYNCRCTLIYHYPEYSDYSKMGRTAYIEPGDADYDPNNPHKQYKTVSGMTYREWQKYKQDQTRQRHGGLTTTSVLKQEPPVEDKRNERISNIMHSHTVDQMTAEQKQEFSEILANMTDEHLELYEHMVEFHEKNNYTNGGGWYVPSSEKVEMTLKANNWEKSIGRKDSTGAWKTKFHEELHQLDHLVGMAQGGNFAAEATRCVGGVWNPPTEMGKRMGEAIRKDVLSFINKGIDYWNASSGLTGKNAVKHLVDLDKPIPRQARWGMFDMLKDMEKKSGNPTKFRAMLSPLTDTIGLSTNNRLSPYSEGYWGHKPSYNKDRGINGATSECFAEIGSHIMRNDTELLGFLQDYMPNSIKECGSAFGEILGFLRGGGRLKYPKH